MLHDILRFIAPNAVLGNVPDIVIIPLKDHEYQYIPIKSDNQGIFAILGRPRGIRVDCEPGALAVRAVHMSPPQGRSRLMRSRKASASFLAQSRRRSKGHRSAAPKINER